GAELVRIPIVAGGPRTDPSSIDLRALYRTILADHGAQLGLAIRAVAQADAPVIVHCTAGKDRTGLVVALSLLALDVPLEDVVADYELTGRHLEGEWTARMVRRLRRFRVEVTPNLLEVVAASPGPVLVDTFEWLEARHG